MNSNDAAMAELRRVCSGDRVPPPPPLPPYSLVDPFKGSRRGWPLPLVEHEDHDTPPDWIYIALVALLALVVGGLVYLLGLP